jgi:hypothetical protein
MARTFSAVVTFGADHLGTAGPFAVEVPWWSEVEPVVALLGRVLDVPVVVLRLLGVEGGVGARDGHVTYHVEALRRPASVLPGPDGHASLNGPQELRAPWARMDGLRELLDWAADALAGMGRPLIGPAEQRRTWNLAALFRLPTARGTVWLKATPSFAADEGAVMAAFARVDPGLVPVVLASGPGRVLLEHLPGVDCWDAPPEIITSAGTRLAAAQASLADPAIGLPDRRDRTLAAQVRALLDDRLADELTARELAAAHDLVKRWPALDACGLPDTIVHGDFHPGNWRSDGGPPVALDWADAYVGNPVLDGLRAYDYLPRHKRHIAAQAWIEAWTSQVPGCDPARALAIAEPLAHLAYAVRYQEFLDGIEPDERIYHLGDPASCVREALRVADTPGLATILSR